MAIQLNFSKMANKEEAFLDPAYTGALERGMVMVRSTNVGPKGQRLVRPSQGLASDRVEGILWLSKHIQESVPTIESLVVPALAPLTVTLQETPIAFSNARAFNTATGAAIVVVDGAPGAGQLGLTGKVLTAHADLTGVAFTILYRFAITAEELARRGARRSISIGGENTYNQVTLAKGKLEVWTSCFNTAANFQAEVAANVTSGANGLATIGGDGPVFASCTQEAVMEHCYVRQAFVGLSCDLPMI